MRRLRWVAAWAVSGYFLDMAYTDHEAVAEKPEGGSSDDARVSKRQTTEISKERLVTELRGLLRRGLPVDERRAGEVLPRLRSVRARAVHPGSRLSCVDALNQLLVKLLVDLDDERFGPVAPILFAVAAGTRGTTLMQRRQRCAEVLQRDPDHFRKHLEPELLVLVADALHRDLLRYRPVPGTTVAPVDLTGQNPSLQPTDYTEKEELTSRIWQHVWGWRAELIAWQRMKGRPGYETQAEQYWQRAEVQKVELRRLKAVYAEKYGMEIRYGEVGYGVS